MSDDSSDFNIHQMSPTFSLNLQPTSSEKYPASTHNRILNNQMVAYCNITEASNVPDGHNSLVIHGQVVNELFVQSSTSALHNNQSVPNLQQYSNNKLQNLSQHQEQLETPSNILIESSNMSTNNYWSQTSVPVHFNNNASSSHQQQTSKPFNTHPSPPFYDQVNNTFNQNQLDGHQPVTMTTHQQSPLQPQHLSINDTNCYSQNSFNSFTEEMKEVVNMDLSGSENQCNMVSCFKCNDLIQDKSFICVGGQNLWHERCVTCCICGISLKNLNSCYMKNNELYCKYDYLRKYYNIRCNSCQQMVLPGDSAFKCFNSWYHDNSKCLSCYVCKTVFATGSFCKLHGAHLICSICESKKAINENGLELVTNGLNGRIYNQNSQTHGFNTIENNTRMNVSYYPQKTKRNRTCFKHHQLRLMKEYFKKNRNPDSKDLKQLGKETLLSKRVLQVWFQNARAKHRRTDQKNENDKSQSRSDSNVVETKNRTCKKEMKEEAQSSNILTPSSSLSQNCSQYSDSTITSIFSRNVIFDELNSEISSDFDEMAISSESSGRASSEKICLSNIQTLNQDDMFESTMLQHQNDIKIDNIIKTNI